MSKGVKSVTKSAKKVTKSVTKAVSKTVGGVLGMPNPDDQRKQAERMAQIQEAQAMQQQANAVEQARAQTMQMQTDADRQRILAEQQQNQTPNDTRAASVDVAVTHALMVDDAWAQMQAAGVRQLWSTDCVPHASNAVSVVPLLAEAVVTLLGTASP